MENMAKHMAKYREQICEPWETAMVFIEINISKNGNMYTYINEHVMKGKDGTIIFEVCEGATNQDIVNRLKGRPKGNHGF